MGSSSSLRGVNYFRDPTKPIKQANVKYIDKELAGRIISDEIATCGEDHPDAPTLKSVFELATGRSYDDSVRKDADVTIKDMPESELYNLLKGKPPQSVKYVEFSGRRLPRDATITAAVKLDRGRECQLCGLAIREKNGASYVEAAHITPKKSGGTERPDNIMILCPNHHKEFDLGDTKIQSRTESGIAFVMNGKEYSVDLGMRARVQNAAPPDSKIPLARPAP